VAVVVAVVVVVVAISTSPQIVKSLPLVIIHYSIETSSVFFHRSLGCWDNCGHDSV